MRPPKELQDALRAGDNFLLATHISPEADALGSALALKEALGALGKRAVVYNRDPLADFNKFLPGFQGVVSSLEGLDTKGMALVLIDCNKPERAAVEGLKFHTSIVIDHHATDSGFGDVAWVVPGAPATGLMMLGLIKALGLGITRDMATNLYAALAVDTGTFRYHNTSPGTLRAAAELAEAGASPGDVAGALYHSWSAGRFKLMCMSIGGIEIEGPIAITTVTEEMYRATGTTASDTEEFAGIANAVDEVKVSVFLRELPEAGGWKVSLRSKGDVDIAAVAQRFGGGGHKNAAGCMVSEDLVTTKRLLLEELRKII